jgi:hypothetical protein
VSAEELVHKIVERAQTMQAPERQRHRNTDRSARASIRPR